jgi:hypothetical protein
MRRPVFYGLKIRSLQIGESVNPMDGVQAAS